MVGKYKIGLTVPPWSLTAETGRYNWECHTANHWQRWVPAAPSDWRSRPFTVYRDWVPGNRYQRVLGSVGAAAVGGIREVRKAFFSISGPLLDYRKPFPNTLMCMAPIR